MVTFDHFVQYEENGQDFRAIAPTLARRMYLKNARVLFKFDNAERAEIVHLLRLAKNAPPSAKSQARAAVTVAPEKGVAYARPCRN